MQTNPESTCKKARTSSRRCYALRRHFAVRRMVLAQAQQLEILVISELRFRLVALKQLEILVVSILRFRVVVLDEQNDCIVRCALSASSKEVHLFLDTTCLAQKLTWWISKKSASVARHDVSRTKDDLVEQ